VLNARLEGLGLALHNLGDIDRQTVSGAVATGTHGSGGRRASLSAQVAALQVVLADGSVREASREQDSGLFEAARLGLGAVGVLTAVTVEVEPAFRLDSTERVVSFAELLAGLAPGGLDTVHDHVDVHWFPYTDRALVKTHDRTLDEARPLSRLRRHVDDELLANRVFGVLAGAGSRSPTRAVRTNRLIARALSGRHYVDASHRVLVSPRRVRFREMEYAVPRPTVREVLVEVRRLLERNRWPVTFPVEIRTAPADDVWLSAAHARATAYLAFHVAAEVDHRPFFTAVEAVLRDHGGRPHWGKLHTRAAADLAPDYPRWPDFAAIRDRIDPERIFTNPYLERVLGP
jgi:FAD-linked oxidoreductase